MLYIIIFLFNIFGLIVFVRFKNLGYFLMFLIVRLLFVYYVELLEYINFERGVNFKDSSDCIVIYV